MPGSRPRPLAPPRASAYPELRRFVRHKGAVTGSVLLLVLIMFQVTRRVLTEEAAEEEQAQHDR